MANITTTEVGDMLATIIAAEALGRLRSNMVLGNLVARDWDNEVATYGQTVQIPFRGALTVNDKAANTDYTVQAPTDTKVDVTLDKHKEVSFIVEDLARALARPDVIMGYIDDGIIAIGEQIEADIAALYAGMSQTIDATAANGPLSVSHFLQARKLLSIAKAPMSDRYAVLHPQGALEALGIEELTNRDYGNDGVLVNPQFRLGNFAGFQVIEAQGIAEVAGVQKNLFFHKNAFALVTRPLPAPQAGTGVITKVMAENGVGIRVMISYQHLKGGHLVTLDCLYGVKALRDNHGVLVETD